MSATEKICGGKGIRNAGRGEVAIINKASRKDLTEKGMFGK